MVRSQRGRAGLPRTRRLIYKPAMHCTALIVAGGRGRRFGGDGMKQFQLLRDRPLLIWTLDAFERCPCIASIVLVIPQDARAQTEQLLGEFGLTQRVTLCNGGAERVDSVRCGLATLPREAELVAVHDAARPLVSAELIERVVSRAAQCKAAIAALPASDTVKTATDERIDGTLERGSIYLAQTPQAFEVGLLRQAHRTWEEAGRPPVTDDAQLVELLGHPVELVCGDRRNIKVTVADDLNLAFSANITIGGGSADSGQLSGNRYFKGVIDDVRLVGKVVGVLRQL